jgi:predicted permease
LGVSLKENSRSVKGTRSLLGRSLLVLQVAVSLVLLMGAGLFLGTLRNLRAVDVGFDPANILLFRLDPTLNGYEEERIPLFYDEVRERLAALGGVESVSLSRTAFLTGSTWSSTVHFQERPDEEGDDAHMMTVSPEFFSTLGIPQMAGRVFDDRDVKDSQAVAVINAAAARQFLDGEDALGKLMGFSPETRGDIEIVGIVRDVKYSSVRDDAPPTVFLPHRQRNAGRMVFEVKTHGDPRALVPTVREAVRGIDTNVPVMDISTQSDEIEERFEQERYFALSYSMFGGLAMLLASIGLFGLASYNVSRRTNEIGVRMALGAQRGDVVRMVLRESMLLVGIGIALGVVVTVAAGRLVTSLLYGVTPTDFLTLAVAIVALITVSAVAGYLPARRASRVDPIVALQYE